MIFSKHKPLEYIVPVPETKEERQLRKAFAHGLNYNMGPQQLIAMAMRKTKGNNLKFTVRSETPIIKGKKK